MKLSNIKLTKNQCIHNENKFPNKMDAESRDWYGKIG
jgi:hypothetical protein